MTVGFLDNRSRACGCEAAENGYGVRQVCADVVDWIARVDLEVDDVSGGGKINHRRCGE